MDDRVDIPPAVDQSAQVKVLSSAHRHGVSTPDIRHALTLWQWHWESDDVTIYVGPAQDGQLLEIGVILDEDDRPVVIHAMKARPQYVP